MVFAFGVVWAGCLYSCGGLCGSGCRLGGVVWVVCCFGFRVFLPSCWVLVSFCGCDLVGGFVSYVI